MTEKELKLHSADKNAAEFIEVVKDKICDWISYHNVYVPSRDKIQVTNNWDGMTYLGFDKKGYSYELTQKEHDYFELVRNAKIDDFLGKLGKAGNEIGNSLKTGLSGLGNLGR